MTGICSYEGQPVAPDMPGCCSRCSLYLNTCATVIRDGFLTGPECDIEYCQYCPVYSDCSVYFPQERSEVYVCIVDEKAG